MSKSELIRRLSHVHREALVTVQKFTKEDFERKAPAEEWSAKDLFAHLAAWNREARQYIGGLNANGSPALQDCREVPAAGAERPLNLAKVMADFRSSLDAIVTAFEKTPAAKVDPDAAEISSGTVTKVIRHYQVHQNDLNALVGSFRPH